MFRSLCSLLENRWHTYLSGILSALLMAGSLKWSLVSTGRIPFNSDEAVVSLMARHILEGARPIFFYGQAYMGSLDAFLIALGFSVFGQQVWVVRFVQACLYLFTIVVMAILAKRITGSDSVGVMTATFLAVPTVNVTLYTTATLGGYGEALLIGSSLMLIAINLGSRIGEFSRKLLSAYFLFGLLIGIGVWAFGLTLVFSVPAALFLLYRVWKQRTALTSNMSILFGAALVGMLIGALPWWIYAIQNGFSQMLWELRGGAIAGVSGLPYNQEIIQHFLSFFLLGLTVIFGFRPPWSVDWLGLFLLPFVLMFWVWVAWQGFLRAKNREEEWKFGDYHILLAGSGLMVIAGFIFTPFGSDPSGRYFVPLVLALSVYASAAIFFLRKRIGYAAYGLVVLVIGYHLWGTMQTAFKFPPGITTQFDQVAQVDHRYMKEMIMFLEAKGENYGYTNYWVSYPLAFLSEEKLIYVPELPYHQDFRYTPRDNRYEPYMQQVETAERVAYITTKHLLLNQALRNGFNALGVTWQEKQIGDYLVFYELSDLVRPEDLEAFIRP